jgi:hypothetical protein
MSKDRRDIVGYKYKDDEQELREKIAQEILDEFETKRNYWLAESPTVHREFSIFKKCAAIARGENE